MSRTIRAIYISLSVVITLSFVIIGALIFPDSYERIGEGFVDLWNSISFYFCEIFGIKHKINPSVLDVSNILNYETNLPESSEGFKASAVDFFELLIDKKNMQGYTKVLAKALFYISRISVIVLPALIILGYGLVRMYKSSNENHNVDTKPLKVFKAVSNYSYQPAKRVVLGYIDFLRENPHIGQLWIVLWFSNLNLTSIIVEFFAYYFYFAVSFEFSTIYVQFVKLWQDLQVILQNFPWYVIVGALYPLFHSYRKKIALNRLHHFEAKNCGFINELPIVSMTCGSMGKKKTTMLTDMALSQEVMFRQKAYELLQSNDMKFPFFPWIAFEMEIQRCMEHRQIYNLATIKEWIAKKRGRFERHWNSTLQLYGYDYEKYGLIYNDSLKEQTLFDVLETYAKLYFIYIIESSLLVSNYSIREDNVLNTQGNFPLWNSDFFPEKIPTESRHAHILDFDVLRLGRKVIEDNPNMGSFEFGVVVITEVGKERCNALELKEVKKEVNSTNQKNDLFNNWLKMCRHSATVDNFPFIKVFTDEQRPESWGADARDLCDIVTIVRSDKQRLCLPFYDIEDMISEWSFNRFINLYYDFRFRRGDNTLFVHLLKIITSALYRRNIRIYNQYGVSDLQVVTEAGVRDGKKRSKKYYLSNRKIYSQRFSTDCFSDYFNDMARKTLVGLNDYLEYETEKATVEELKMQNSYFINALYKDVDGNLAS